MKASILKLLFKLLDRLFQGKEGNILLFGLLLILCTVIFIIITYQIDTQFANKITSIIFTNLFVGRVPALSIGYASKLSHIHVIGINVLTEFILVTILYPLFIFSFNGILKIEMLEHFFSEVKKKKQEHQKKFDKYGKLGLFIFVFFPFWMTGPIVGSIIGFLIGMSHYTIIFIVLIATIIAISLWGFFLQEIIDIILIFNSEMLWIVIFIVVVILLLFRFKHLIHK